MTVMREMPPSAKYSYTRSACCRPACGRARIEFSICTIAGPGRAGVGVGVAGSAAVPHPARAASAALMASTASSRFTAVDIHAQYKEKRQRQPNRTRRSGGDADLAEGGAELAQVALVPLAPIQYEVGEGRFGEPLTADGVGFRIGDFELDPDDPSLDQPRRVVVVFDQSNQLKFSKHCYHSWAKTDWRLLLFIPNGESEKIHHFRKPARSGNTEGGR